MLAVSIRITTETRKELEATLSWAFEAGDLGMVERVTALLGIAREEAVTLIAAGVGVSPSTVYAWPRAFLLAGVAGLPVRWRGGRPRKLTKTQRERLDGIAVRHPQPLLPVVRRPRRLRRGRARCLRAPAGSRQGALRTAPLTDGRPDYGRPDRRRPGRRTQNVF